MNSIKYIIWFAFIYISITDLASGDDDLGCIMEPNKGNGMSPTDQTLKKLEHLFGKSFTYLDKSKDFQYDLTICGSADKKDKRVTIARQKLSQRTYSTLALRDRTTRVSEADNTFMLLFNGVANDTSVLNNCDEVSSALFIICDQSSVQGVFRNVIIDDDFCTYTFELKISSVCKSVPSTGMGGWSIFFLIIFIMVVIYFAIGFVYMRFVIGAKGIEQVPNRTMWISVGNGIADFVDALCRCDRFCGPSEGSVYSDYSPIGGATGGSPQADQDTSLLRP